MINKYSKFVDYRKLNEEVSTSVGDDGNSGGGLFGALKNMFGKLLSTVSDELKKPVEELTAKLSKTKKPINMKAIINDYLSGFNERLSASLATATDLDNDKTGLYKLVVDNLTVLNVSINASIKSLGDNNFTFEEIFADSPNSVKKLFTKWIKNFKPKAEKFAKKLVDDYNKVHKFGIVQDSYLYEENSNKQFILRRSDQNGENHEYFRFFYEGASSREVANSFGIEVRPLEGKPPTYEQWSSDKSQAKIFPDNNETQNFWDEMMVKHRGGSYNYYFEDVNNMLESKIFEADEKKDINAIQQDEKMIALTSDIKKWFADAVFKPLQVGLKKDTKDVSQEGQVTWKTKNVDNANKMMNIIKGLDVEDLVKVRELLTDMGKGSKEEIGKF